MPVTININNISLCHKGSNGISTATIPDVCKTPAPPGPPVPIPYPNIAMSMDLMKGTKKVKADGGMMCAIDGSEFMKSTGDEPGVAGGVASSTFIKEATWITFSMDVKFEGKGACRLTDKMFHNHQNTVNMAGVIQSPLSTAPTDLDCEAAWSEAEKPMKDIMKETDPIERNKKISAAYAQVYKDQPQLKWFGAAAFASKQVGCGMEHAKTVSEEPAPWFMGKGEKAKKSLEKLGDGNKAVFEEMHPAQEFYKKHGVKGLKQCASSRKPEPLPPKVVEGFEMADKAKITNDSALADKAAETMLFQEQHVTLQKSAYDDQVFKDVLKENQEWNEGWIPTFGYAKPTKVVFDAACEASGAPSFEMTGGNLGDPKWRWDYAKGTTQKFSDLASTDPNRISSALDGIIKAGS